MAPEQHRPAVAALDAWEEEEDGEEKLSRGSVLIHKGSAWGWKESVRFPATVLFRTSPWAILSGATHVTLPNRGNRFVGWAEHNTPMRLLGVSGPYFS
jgi:hypothetical protein